MFLEVTVKIKPTGANILLMVVATLQIFVGCFIGNVPLCLWAIFSYLMACTELE